MRDFTRDLTIMVVGTGKTTWANLQENLDDWVFGKLDDFYSVDSREVKIIFPILHRSGPILSLMTRYAMDKDADVQVVQTKDAPMNRDLSALPDILVTNNEHETLMTSFSLLKTREAEGDEVVFLMAFDPESTYTQGQDALSDLEIIYEAKAETDLLTLNLDGMVDFFEGYESEEDKADREAKEAAFKAEQAALTPAPVKKATAPRKRAAKKAVAPKAIEAPVEPQKAVQTPSEPISESLTPGLDALIEKSMEKEQEGRKVRAMHAQVTDITIENSEMAQHFIRKSDVAPTDDVWSDVAKAVSPWDTSRQDVLLVELGENIAEMGAAFSKTIRTMSELFKERNV